MMSLQHILSDLEVVVYYYVKCIHIFIPYLFVWYKDVQHVLLLKPREYFDARKEQNVHSIIKVFNCVMHLQFVVFPLWFFIQPVWLLGDKVAVISHALWQFSKLQCHNTILSSHLLLENFLRIYIQVDITY